MTLSYFDDMEVSTQEANPVELYIFNYGDITYTYTSSQYTQRAKIENKFYVFSPEYLKRSDSLNLSTSDTNNETCTIEVLRTNSIALLYQSAPPEDGQITVKIFRIHGEDNSNYVRILYGTVSQVQFNGSIAVLTITIENVLARNIPRGYFSYYCQNCIYDNKCKLKEDEYAHLCYVDEGFYITRIYSTNLLEKPNGYFTDGYIKMGATYRQIVEHNQDMIRLKYPISQSDYSNEFLAYPGCSNLFMKCALTFHNTDNFSGVPYMMPLDVYDNPNNNVVYWINSEVITRDTNGRIYQ